VICLGYYSFGGQEIPNNDCGTNFIGGKSELDEASKDAELANIKRWVTEQDYEWLFNPPHASHFGGVWERQIGILDAMMLKIGPSQLTHEVLTTLMAEVTGIVNARPIALIPTDTDQPQPLTPAMLLTMKTKPLLPECLSIKIHTRKDIGEESST
jgi:hypothetical protein